LAGIKGSLSPAGSSTWWPFEVTAGLRRAQELRLALAKAQRDVQDHEGQLRAITDDQARLRLNLREMPTTAQAYKRYLDKFDRQETQVEQLQQDLQKSRQAEGDRKKELDDFLASFSAE
jgi:chromosome segregation ATPase